MTEDILERAKALRSSAFGTHKQALDVVDELIADIERLRSLTLDQQYMMDDLDKEIASKDARIKELEEANRNIDKRRDEMAAFIERLEAAFLEAKSENQFHQNYGESEWAIHPEEDFEGHWGRNRFRSEAREALERIRNGGKDEPQL